ncbi:MAG: type transport system permease protein [Clostridiales bacterium]|nr:type transport system permease protein [Clostridiales bacterium]
MKTFFSMWKVELRLSIRDMNMIIFALVMPLVVLVLLGIIYGKQTAYPGTDVTFLEQSFGALTTISISAGGLMGLPILIAEYRERKILKRFWVTPIHPAVILGVHLCLYVLYAIVSLVTLWITAFIFWRVQIRGSIGLFLGGWLFVLLSILSIGLLVGGVSKNSKQASVIASLLYFPMLVFSGATLPYEVMPLLMQRMVEVLPLTQGIKILKAAMLGLPVGQIWISICLLGVLALFCIIGSVKFFRWE